MKINGGGQNKTTECSELLDNEFPLPKIGETLFPNGKSACGVYLTELFLGRIFY